MPITTFLRLLDTDDKAAALLDAIQGHAPQRIFLTDPASFAQVPGSPFAYWVGEKIQKLFQQCESFETDQRFARRGPSSGDDFRRVRGWWEVAPEAIGRDKSWVPFSKGGSFSPFYADIHLLVAWDEDRRTFAGFFGRPGRMIERPESLDFFFRSGLTWPARTQRGFNIRVLPVGCIFSHKGPSAFIESDRPAKILPILGLMNSQLFAYFIDMQMSFGSYEVGVIQRTPVPDLNNPDGERLGVLALACVHLKRNLDTANEISHVFHLPALLQVRGETLADRAAAWAKKIADSEAQLAANQREIDEIAFRLYGIEGEDRRAIEESLNHRGTEALSAEKDDGEDVDESISTDDQTSVSLRLCGELTSYLVGLPFGRWDIRYATGERSAPELPDPFAPLPVCPPGMLQNAQGLPAAPEDVPTSYPLRISWPGILVDDAGHAEDIAGRVREAIRVVVSSQWSVVSSQWSVDNQDNVSNAELTTDHWQLTTDHRQLTTDHWQLTTDHWQLTTDRIEQEACEILGVTSLREYLRRPAGFFADHLSRYSKSRRQAPIYWPLAVGSNYTIWLSYHRLTDQTLYRCVNDFIDPKLNIVSDQWAVISQKSGRTAREEKELEQLRDLIRELTELRAEILRIAVFWKPNLNDGVQISAAPLWRLFQHRPWQKKLKETWESLERGDYDWAHLAYSIWPARVREKCITDKSLAIAHGLEEVYVEVAAGKKGRGKKPTANTTGKKPTANITGKKPTANTTGKKPTANITTNARMALEGEE